MKTLKLVIILLLTGGIAQAQDSQKAYFDNANVFFEAFVKDGRVAYNVLQQRPQPLNELVNTIAEADLSSISANEKKAFLINAYNILTINSIIKNGVPDSPLSVDGFFDKQTHTVGGAELTLNQVEKEMLLPVYNDARLHFVLVCAAIGCPKLQSYAYVPSSLEEQMQSATVEALNNDYFVRVDANSKKVELSEIFNWYNGDFLAESESLLSYVNQFRNQKIPADFSVGHYTYDWNLNKQ